MDAATDTLPRELDRAADKFHKQQERAWDRFGFGATDAGLALVDQCIPRLTKVLPGILKRPNTQNEERALFSILRDLNPEVLALCVLQTTLHVVGMTGAFRNTLEIIGRAIGDECWAAKLTSEQPVLAAKIERFVRRSSSGLKQRRQAARVLAVEGDFNERRWTRKRCLLAGTWATNVLVEHLPDVFVREEDGHDEQHLTITPEATAHAHSIIAQLIMRHPVYLPRPEAPRPWTQWNQGGTWDDRLANTLTVVRTHHKSTQAAVRAAIRDGSMKPALDAVNTLQAVPWTINTKVLGVMRTCVEQGIEVPGLPRGALPMPAKSQPWEEMSDKERRLWRHQASAVKTANRGFVSDAVLYAEDIATADEMAQHERFHTAMNFDWRGRVYGVPSFNFQREDRVRSLFLFADGEPIGEEGLYWLKVHVANCGDFDKISKRPFEERVQWVDENIERLEDCATVPLSERWWMQADKPFLFLAGCLELVSARRTGPSFVTRLPISFDGSCSGLQHLCALTRAAEGSLVNLTPNTAPQDVYQTVADTAASRIAQEALGTVQPARTMAELCRGYGITRGVVKRNVMTYSYSSKKFGMAEQQREDLMKPLALEVLQGKRDEHPFASEYDFGMKHDKKVSLPAGSAAAKYIAGHVYASIEEVVEKPALAMGFLQKLAKTMAHEGKPLRWTTPIGLPWINRYHAPECTRVILWLYDRGVRTQHRVKLAVGEERAIDKDKAANGVAPNFVHALDAAHLLRVANAAAAEGITALATVHDSFGCLASRAGRFRKLIREEFVRMYQDHDPLTEVLQQAKCDLTQHNWERLPDVPEFGPLNIEEVLDAEFAFA